MRTGGSPLQVDAGDREGRLGLRRTHPPRVDHHALLRRKEVCRGRVHGVDRLVAAEGLLAQQDDAAVAAVGVAAVGRVAVQPLAARQRLLRLPLHGHKALVGLLQQGDVGGQPREGPGHPSMARVALGRGLEGLPRCAVRCPVVVRVDVGQNIPADHAEPPTRSPGSPTAPARPL